MTLHRRTLILGIALLVCSLGSSALASHAAAKRGHPQHIRVYKAIGTVTSVDQEDDTFTVDFEWANRAMRNALGGDLSDVSIAVDDDTEFAVNGDDSADLSDLCSDDQVTVVIRTPDRLYGHDLTDHPAYSVDAIADLGECLD